MLHLTKAEEEKEETFRDKDSGADLEVQEKQSLLEWLANNYKKVCRTGHAACVSIAQHVGVCPAACLLVGSCVILWAAHFKHIDL